MQSAIEVGKTYLGPASELVRLVEIGTFSYIIQQLEPVFLSRKYITSEDFHRFYKPIEPEKVAM